MQKNDFHTQTKVACITGGAKRIGKAIVEAFHQAGFNVIIHYHQSIDEAQALANQCNHARPHSAVCVQADLENFDELAVFCEKVIHCFNRLDVLVHNASRFYPTKIGAISQNDWQQLMASNAQAPLFLSQYLNNALQTSQGCIISILDIHANARPFVGYSVYNMAKSAHQMLVQSLALELAPNVRVNGISPGVNVLPEQHSEQALTTTQIAKICQSIPLNAIGKPFDIANAVLFLATADYITGQILAVDGGRSLTLAGGYPP